MCALALDQECGKGSTDDEMSSCHVAMLGGLPISIKQDQGTLCVLQILHMCMCRGNQFDQLRVGGDHVEVYISS